MIVAGGFVGAEDRRSSRAGAGVGVEGVDAVVLGGDEDNVVGARRRRRGEVERLRVDLAVDGEEADLPNWLSSRWGGVRMVSWG